jgi:hypothetical protein
MCYCANFLPAWAQALPAVSAPNGKFEFDAGALSVPAPRFMGRAAGTLTLPLGERFGVQADFSAATAPGFTTTAAFHVFTRDPAAYLIGGTLGFVRSPGALVVAAGPEAELYRDRWTLEAWAGVAMVHPSASAPNRFGPFVLANVGYYVTDDWRVGIGLSSLDGYNSLEISSEYLLRDFDVPLALTGAARVGQDGAVRVLAGLRGYLSPDPNKSLIDRHREDDPADRGTALYIAAGTQTLSGTKPSEGNGSAQATSRDQETDQGAGNDQGTGTDQGIGGDQGAATEQEIGNEQGTGGDQGTGTDQGSGGTGTDQGSGSGDQGIGGDQGAGTDQGTGGDQSSDQGAGSGDQGTGGGQGTGDQGTDNGQGTGNDQGTGGDQWTGTDQGSGSGDQGIGGEGTGSDNGQGTGDDQGTGGDQGAGGDDGTVTGQGTGGDQGTGPDQGTGGDQGSENDGGTGNEDFSVPPDWCSSDPLTMLTWDTVEGVCYGPSGVVPPP